MTRKAVSVVAAILFFLVFLSAGSALAQEVKKKAVIDKAKVAEISKAMLATKKIGSDPDEPAVTNSKDFQKIGVAIVGSNLHTQIHFYADLGLSEFFYYFSTDADQAAEILVRCRPSQFEVAKQTRKGLYNNVVHTGTPSVSGNKYSLTFPWAKIFGGRDSIRLWLFSMDGRDRMPNSGMITLSWWTLVSCSRHETTMYQGVRDYKPTPTGWWLRCDGEVDTNYNSYFPDINNRPASVGTLLSAIGCPTSSTSNDGEIWNRIVAVWTWLQSNQLEEGDANYEAAHSYIRGLGHWPSLADTAHVYVTYGGIYWGTCMSRAQLFATLLYAVGINKRKFGIAESYWKPEYSQHMFVVVYLNNHWYYLDPTNIGASISTTTPASIGGGPADYVHPLGIKPLPGGNFWGVPLIE